MNKNKTFTTGQVAKICSVAPGTVTKWFDSGQLKGYRIPGSKDRRIPQNELLRFIKTNNIPANGFNYGTIRIILADSDINWLDHTTEKINEKPNYIANWADNIFDIGYLAAKITPHIIIINIMEKALDPHQLCRSIRSNKDLIHCKIIAVAPKLNKNETNALLQKGYDDIISPLPTIQTLISAIENATSMIF